MKFILKFLLLLVVLASVATGVIWYQYDAFIQRPITVTDSNRIVTIKSGSSIRQIAQQLQTTGVIDSAVLFELQARFSQQANAVKAGEYNLEQGVLPATLLKQLVSGKALQYQLSIIEGKTFKDILNAVRTHPQLKQTLTDTNTSTIMQAVGAPAGMAAEGWFFPDNYSFPRQTTDVEFLKRSYLAMDKYLQTAWEKREPHTYIKTPYEALILASIVEKETGLAIERPLVARVFLNRLEQDMLLQTDPTVIYGLGDKYDGNIRKTDLTTDTPYNTYTRKGLPPTPIATPSKAAIDAVMHPATSRALYFVATAPGAASKFSETLEEHNRAVQQYILNRNTVVPPTTPALPSATINPEVKP